MNSDGSPAPVAEQLSIQARADQIMAGVSEAHEILDGVLSAPPSEAVDSPSGAEQQLDRCREGLASLNTRLQDLSRRMGKL